jgi:hypothetical protein
MNKLDLTPHQLRRAASVKEKLDALNRELRSLLGGSSSDGAVSRKKRTMGAAVKRKLPLRSGRDGPSASGQKLRTAMKVPKKRALG